MGFLSNLFGRNKQKRLEPPKSDNQESEFAIANTESQEDTIKTNNSNDIREVIFFQIDQALSEYDEWYSKTFHKNEEQYKGALDIINGVEEGEFLVILNYKSTKANDKIDLAIVNVQGEDRVEKLKFLRKKIDSMISTIYKKNLTPNNMKAYLQATMDEIKSKMFNIEFTSEGKHVLLNEEGYIIDRTVTLDMDNEENGAVVKNYKRRYNTFGVSRDIFITEVQTTVTRKINRIDAQSLANYKKNFYISDIQHLGEVAEAIRIVQVRK